LNVVLLAWAVVSVVWVTRLRGRVENLHHGIETLLAANRGLQHCVKFNRRRYLSAVRQAKVEHHARDMLRMHCEDVAAGLARSKEYLTTAADRYERIGKA
jgi:hypothetical protein